MARWSDRATDVFVGMFAVWLLLVVGTVAAVLFGVYVASIGALILLFLSLRWLLKKVL